MNGRYRRFASPSWLFVSPCRLEKADSSERLHRLGTSLLLLKAIVWNEIVRKIAIRT